MHTLAKAVDADVGDGAFRFAVEVDGEVAIERRELAGPGHTDHRIEQAGKAAAVDFDKNVEIIDVTGCRVARTERPDITLQQHRVAGAEIHAAVEVVVSDEAIGPVGESARVVHGDAYFDTRIGAKRDRHGAAIEAEQDRAIGRELVGRGVVVRGAIVVEAQQRQSREHAIDADQLTRGQTVRVEASFKAGIDRRVMLTGFQNDEVGFACDGIGIAVDSIVSALVLRREGQASRGASRRIGRDELNEILTRLQRAEVV